MKILHHVIMDCEHPDVENVILDVFADGCEEAVSIAKAALPSLPHKKAAVFSDGRMMLKVEEQDEHE